jgi:hypothetical protein
MGFAGLNPSYELTAGEFLRSATAQSHRRKSVACFAALLSRKPGEEINFKESFFYP